jgi:hypothetical protein
MGNHRVRIARLERESAVPDGRASIWTGPIGGMTRREVRESLLARCTAYLKSGDLPEHERQRVLGVVERLKRTLQDDGGGGVGKTQTTSRPT